MSFKKFYFSLFFNGNRNIANIVSVEEYKLLNFIVDCYYGKNIKPSKEFLDSYTENYNWKDFKIFNNNFDFYSKPHLEFYFKDVKIFTLCIKRLYNSVNIIWDYKFHTDIHDITPFVPFIDSIRTTHIAYTNYELKKKNAVLDEYQTLTNKFSNYKIRQ